MTLKMKSTITRAALSRSAISLLLACAAFSGALVSCGSTPSHFAARERCQLDVLKKAPFKRNVQFPRKSIKHDESENDETKTFNLKGAIIAMDKFGRAQTRWYHCVLSWKKGGELDQGWSYIIGPKIALTPEQL